MIINIVVFVKKKCMIFFLLHLIKYITLQKGSRKNEGFY